MASLEEDRWPARENFRVRRLYDETQYRRLYQENDSWVRPLLQKLGELEWGRSRFVVDLKIDTTGADEDHGWTVRKLAENFHYQVSICSFEIEGKTTLGFFIMTGGEMIFSRDFAVESLQEAINRVLKQGPTHLEPPGKSRG